MCVSFRNRRGIATGEIERVTLHFHVIYRECENYKHILRT